MNLSLLFMGRFCLARRSRVGMSSGRERTLFELFKREKTVWEVRNLFRRKRVRLGRPFTEGEDGTERSVSGKDRRN